MPRIILGLLISYLIGSIPTGYIFGRLIKRLDIRKFGSGNIGATNVLRVLGPGWGITVLFLDILKGFIPVFFLGDFLSLCYSRMILSGIPTTTIISDELLRILIGITCISGHNWTIFLRFKGGKGVATALGVLIGLSIKISGLKAALCLSVLTWILIFLIIRIVSIASVLSAVSLPIYAVIFRQSALILALSILLCGFAVLRHKSNIKRFLQGKETPLWGKNK